MDKSVDIQIIAEPLSIDRCYDFVVDPSCGGICIFVGTVRNHNKGADVTHLDFEAYKPMAISELSKIAQRAEEQFEVKKMSIHHREGETKITDKAVIIAVSTIHRDAAFKACQFVIDELKKTVPIWKKEFLTDGSYWVNARP